MIRRPIFVLYRTQPDGTFQGVSYFYEVLDDDQLRAIIERVPQVTIKKGETAPPTTELFIPCEKERDVARLPEALGH